MIKERKEQKVIVQWFSIKETPSSLQKLMAVLLKPQTKKGDSNVNNI